MARGLEAVPSVSAFCSPQLSSVDCDRLKRRLMIWRERERETIAHSFCPLAKTENGAGREQTDWRQCEGDSCVRVSANVGRQEYGRMDGWKGESREHESGTRVEGM